MYPSYVTSAHRRDCDSLFLLLNSAFRLEVGREGLAYRRSDKYALKDQTRKHLDDMLVLRDHRKILGCVRAVSHKGVLEIGPVAVHPEYQGLGFGKKLMDAAEARAKGDTVSVGVVSCRTDVIPFFIKRGYQRLLAKPIAEMRKLYPEDLAEEVLTRDDIEWVILVKKLKMEED